jgi:hypothetical protein
MMNKSIPELRRLWNRLNDSVRSKSFRDLLYAKPQWGRSDLAEFNLESSLQQKL